MRLRRRAAGRRSSMCRSRSSVRPAAAWPGLWGVWCRRCEHSGRVTETVAVVVPIPPSARDGLIVTATLRQAGVARRSGRGCGSPREPDAPPLVTAPMVQLNTPYPATAYLAGFLRQHGEERTWRLPRPTLRWSCSCVCIAARGSSAVRGRARRAARPPKARARRHVARASRTPIATSRPSRRPAVSAGRRPQLAAGSSAGILARRAAFRAVGRAPARPPTRGTRARWAFGELAVATGPSTSRASTSTTSPTRSATASIRASSCRATARSWPRARRASIRWRAALEAPPTLVDDARSTRSARELCARHRPDLVGLTRAFPGNVYGAFRIARADQARAHRGAPRPRRRLRQHRAARAREPRVFDYFDYVTLDDGERPLLCLLEHLAEPAESPPTPLLRTFVREGGQVVFEDRSRAARRPHADDRHPHLRGPAARSLPLAVRDAEPDAPHLVGRPLEQADARARLLLEEVQLLRRHARLHRALRAGVGRSARRPDRSAGRRRRARPAFTSSTKRRRPRCCARWPSGCSTRGVAITWWGNIRFEKTFTPALAELLARSGCVAVTGGLEVASNRLLELMNKGVTVEQVARVTRAFTDAGIMVHAYLMYGFPDRDRAGDDRRARARAAALRRGVHPVGVLAPLRGDGAQPDRPRAQSGSASGCCRGPATFARNELAFEDPDRHRSRLPRRGAAKGPLQLHARRGARPGRALLVLGAARPVALGGRKRSSQPGRRAAARPRRVPTPKVPRDLIVERVTRGLSPPCPSNLGSRPSSTNRRCSRAATRPSRAPCSTMPKMRAHNGPASAGVGRTTGGYTSYGTTATSTRRSRRSSSWRRRSAATRCGSPGGWR